MEAVSPRASSSICLNSGDIPLIMSQHGRWHHCGSVREGEITQCVRKSQKVLEPVVFLFGLLFSFHFVLLLALLSQCQSV